VLTIAPATADAKPDTAFHRRCSYAFGDTLRPEHCNELKIKLTEGPLPGPKGIKPTAPPRNTIAPVVDHNGSRCRFKRKFLARCRRAFGPDLSLKKCLDLQLAAIELDKEYMSFNAELPRCPATWKDVVALEKEKKPAHQRFMTGTTYEIKWKAKRKHTNKPYYFTDRDHHGARWGARGKVMAARIGDKDVTSPPWRVQCTYDESGQYIEEAVPARGTADRYGNLPPHQRWDVYWYHAALYADGLEVTGPYTCAYRALNATSAACPAGDPQCRNPVGDPVAPVGASAPIPQDPHEPLCVIDAPSEDNAAPVEDTATPGEDTAAFVEDTAAPGEDPAPSGEDTAPPGEDTAPPGEDTAPHFDVVAAFIEDAMPLVEGTFAFLEGTAALGRGTATFVEDIAVVFEVIGAAVENIEVP
jgi:hypothetical protein